MPYYWTTLPSPSQADLPDTLSGTGADGLAGLRRNPTGRATLDPAQDPQPLSQQLTLWPHNGLSTRGFVAMMLIFGVFALFPLYAVLGTALFWGLLPFMLAAMAGLYAALRSNARGRQILETLTVTPSVTTLTRQNPDGTTQSWDSNTYWVSVALHSAGGPVPNYVTLKGSTREVEIGAFLSEEERVALFTDLQGAVRRAKER